MNKLIIFAIVLFTVTSVDNFSVDTFDFRSMYQRNITITDGCIFSAYPQYHCGGYTTNSYRMSLVCYQGLGQSQSKCCCEPPKRIFVIENGVTIQKGTCRYYDACFPQDATVICKERGNITMAELRLGDQILAYSKQEGYHYSRVLGWLHKKVDESSQYLKLTDSNGSFFHVSPLHSLALENGTYDFARNVGKQRLFHTDRTVERIQKEVKKGLYAPFTQTGNYFVVKSDGTKTLAHCNSNMHNPQKYDWFVRLVFKAFPQSLEQTHPAMKLAQSQILRKLFVMFGLTTLN